MQLQPITLFLVNSCNSLVAAIGTACPWPLQTIRKICKILLAYIYKIIKSTLFKRCVVYYQRKLKQFIYFMQSTLSPVYGHLALLHCVINKPQYQFDQLWWPYEEQSLLSNKKFEN